jgi:NAD+ kinase
MKRVAIIVNDTKLGAQALVQEVSARLTDMGMEHFITLNSKTAAEEFRRLLTQRKNSHCDALIAIGGDGTILSAARLVLPYGIPVLGINAGRVGFLAGLERDELDKLSQLAEKRFVLEQRMLLNVKVLHEKQQEYQQWCINDAVISRHSTSRQADLSVDCNGHVLTYLGDGIIFSTPTGSTAYGFSAGGPVVDPQMETIVLTPICSHKLFHHSIAFAPQARFSVAIAREGLALSCDTEILELLPGQTVTVCRDERMARFIRLKPQSFLGVLNEKMINK